METINKKVLLGVGTVVDAVVPSPKKASLA